MNIISPAPKSPQFLQVAVGVIKNDVGEILISQRPMQVHQGGLWEFPGGKIEAGESVKYALTRELREELAICVEHCEPLIKIHHHYSDVSVMLDVWLVEQFSGIAKGQEGQTIRWVSIHELANYDFPAANLPIIHAAQLPCFYAILDDTHPNCLIPHLHTLLSKNIQLIQARLKNLSAQAVEAFFQYAVPLCQKKGVQLLLNSAVKNVEKFEVGLHLTSHDLMQLNTRPKINGWLAASCHNLAQLQHAEKIGIDFAVLSPVLKTATHPEASILGWEQFSELIMHVNIPVYALGGLTSADKTIARHFGGQGIAGIRTFLR